MVRSHPELLQQVDVILLLLDQFPDRLHSSGLVLGSKGCWHAPGVQGHQLEADDGSETSRCSEVVGEDEGGGEAKAAEEEQAEAADCCPSGGPSGWNACEQRWCHCVDSTVKLYLTRSVCKERQKQIIFHSPGEIPLIGLSDIQHLGFNMWTYISEGLSQWHNVLPCQKHKIVLLGF